MDRALVLRDVWKSVRGRQILRGISLELRPGEVLALIGPNGAGKTTTLRIAAGVLKPSSGEVLVYGRRYDEGNSLELRRLVGYLPEDSGTYRQMTGRSFLMFVARLYSGGDRSRAEEMVRYAEKLSGLGPRLDERLKGYSKGMRRRLLLAATLMARPRLAILDEPTSGLDAYHAARMRQAILDYIEDTGAALIFSSHNMAEVEQLSTRIAVISGGRIVAEGTPEELVHEYSASSLEEAFLRAVGLGE